jgi:hypothetical protein
MIQSMRHEANFFFNALHIDKGGSLLIIAAKNAKKMVSGEW